VSDPSLILSIYYVCVGQPHVHCLHCCCREAHHISHPVPVLVRGEITWEYLHAVVLMNPVTSYLRSCSIGHPPHSSASPIELRLRVGPHALSGKKKNLGNRV